MARVEPFLAKLQFEFLEVLSTVRNPMKNHRQRDDLHKDGGHALVAYRFNKTTGGKL